MCRGSRIVPGAAATEIELAKRVKEFSFKETGYFVFLFKFSIQKTLVCLLVDTSICLFVYACIFHLVFGFFF